MAITNLNNMHLTTAQLDAIEDALTQLEAALSVLSVNLTSDDRQKYGSINEQHKLLVNKVNDYRNSQPALNSPEVDWAEFGSDYISRQAYESFIARLDSLIRLLTDAKILHDYDNYQAALLDYAYASYKAGSSAAGFQNKYSELKQFFARSGKTAAAPAPAEGA
jgi:hypothetical protein